MSICSTTTLSRADAEARLIALLTEQITAVPQLSNEDLEDRLDELSESVFEDFRIA